MAPAAPEPRPLRAAGALAALGVAGLVGAVLMSALAVMPPERALPVVSSSLAASTLSDQLGLAPAAPGVALVTGSGDHVSGPPFQTVSDSGEDTFYKLEFPADGA